jgi:hypothetical protein
MLIHEVPLRDVKVGVWCAMSATSVIGLIFESINSRQFEHQPDCDRINVFFPLPPRQRNYSDRRQPYVCYVVFWMTQWYVRDCDLTAREVWTRAVYVHPLSVLEDDVYSNSPRTEGDLEKHSCYSLLFVLAPLERRRQTNSVFVKYDWCLRAEGNHFQPVLQTSKVKTCH